MTENAEKNNVEQGKCRKKRYVKGKHRKKFRMKKMSTEYVILFFKLPLVVIRLFVSPHLHGLWPCLYTRKNNTVLTLCASTLVS